MRIFYDIKKITQSDLYIIKGGSLINYNTSLLFFLINLYTIEFKDRETPVDNKRPVVEHAFIVNTANIRCTRIIIDT